MFTGWVIHHGKSQQGVYCGWLHFSSGKRIKTSDVNYHVQRCYCGGKSVVARSNNDQHIADFFREPECDVLSSTDKKELNAAVTKMVLSTLRPYEIANEPFFMDVISKAMEIGSLHGKQNQKTCRFDLTGKSKLISGDGVRANLDKV